MTTIFSQSNSFNAVIVRESSAVSGLEDGKVYVLAASTDLFVDAVKTAIKHFKNLMDKEGLIYHYDVCVIEDFKSVITPGTLYDEVKKGGNLILPISTPNDTEKLYLMAQTDAASLDMFVPSMVMQAENLTKQAVVNALQNLAVLESESCDKLFKEAFLNHLPTKSENISVENIFGMRLSGLLGHLGGFGGMAMFPTRGFYDAIPADTSYKKSREIISRFVKNLKMMERMEKKQKISEAQEKKLQKAQNEVNYVFNLFTPNVYSRFALLFMKKKNITFAFDNCLNRDKMASNSKIKVSVALPKPEVEAKFDPKIVNKLKTNGKFRVYLTDGVDTVQVKFDRTISCVVYIMYLLDRKQREDDIDSLKISKNEKLFCYLYSSLYNELDAKKNFNTINTKSSDNKAPRSRLADYYSDIRQALDEAVSFFGESALPFYIPNENSHITILSSNICIPETFKNVSFVY